MRIAKMVLVFGVLALSILLCLWAADVIEGGVASASAKKAGLIIGVLGAASSALFAILGSRRVGPQTERPPNSGPHF